MEETYNPVNTAPAPAPQPKRRKLLFVFLLLVAVALAAALYATRQRTADFSDAPKELVSGQVAIGDASFEPATIKIKKGESVTWTNESDRAHQVASDPHPGNDALPGLFSPEPMGNGDTYTYTFEESGTFTYHDHLNPYEIQGTVIVE